MILNGFLYLIKIILQIYSSLVIFDIILSWFPKTREIKIFKIIHEIAEWYIEPFSDFLVLGSVDFSPVIGLLILEAVINFCL